MGRDGITSSSLRLLLSVTPTPSHWCGTLSPLHWAPISRSQVVLVALCPHQTYFCCECHAGEPLLLFVGRPAYVEMGHSPAKSENRSGSRVLGVYMALLSNPRPRTSQLRTKPRMLTSAGSSALNEISVLFLKGRDEPTGGKPIYRGQTWPHRSLPCFHREVRSVRGSFSPSPTDLENHMLGLTGN